VLRSFYHFVERIVKPLSLTPAQQRRLERLARDAGRTPEQTLRFVLRDGFDFCEWEVRRSRLADSEAKRLGTLSNEEVQRRAQAIIDGARARKAPKAA
jgi:hypothetical protein